MASRIVVFGATGYTGRLTVQALVEQGRRPVLAGRSDVKLKAMAEEFGGLDHAVADVDQPDSVAALLSKGDVLITLVGPFVRWGGPAVEAAIAAGAHYLDSTGEPPFMRQIFERYSPPARAAGVALLTAMGYDYVPGNLAAGLALRDAGPAATRVSVGYFVTGRLGPGAISGGTAASLAGAMHGGFRRVDGLLETERPGVRFREFSVGGRTRGGISLGASEHYTIPQAFPNVTSVETYLGWFGRQSRRISLLARTGGAVVALPPIKKLADRVVEQRLPGSTGGPDETVRAGHRTLVVAEAFDRDDVRLGRAVVEGVGPYDFTGRMLAWTAGRIADQGPREVGAVGPITALGLDDLIDGAARSGLERSE